MSILNVSLHLYLQYTCIASQKGHNVLPQRVAFESISWVVSKCWMVKKVIWSSPFKWAVIGCCRIWKQRVADWHYFETNALLSQINALFSESYENEALSKALFLLATRCFGKAMRCFGKAMRCFGKATRCTLVWESNALWQSVMTLLACHTRGPQGNLRITCAQSDLQTEGSGMPTFF